MNSPIGKLFRCAIGWLQFSLGVSYSALAHPASSLPHMESKWIASMRTFPAEQKLSLLLDRLYIPPKQREHDSYIMDHILESNHYSPAEIRKLNYCRLYLNVVTVSDLTKPDGVTIDEAILSGLPSAQSSRLAKHGVHQERPSQPEWTLWRRANLLWATLTGPSASRRMGSPEARTPPSSLCLSSQSQSMAPVQCRLQRVSRILRSGSIPPSTRLPKFRTSKFSPFLSNACRSLAIHNPCWLDP